MPQVQKNALDLLKEIMEQRNWHQGKLIPSRASQYKSLLKKGKLSYERAALFLRQLGWVKTEEEVWENVLENIKNEQSPP